MTSEEIKALIEVGISGAEAYVDGDGNHFVAQVISAEFADLSQVKQHQRVYAALGDKIGDAIHALSIHTYTPAEWLKIKPFQNV